MMASAAAEIPQLKVSELYTKRQSRDAARLRAYNQILNQIYHRIRVMSKMPGNPCYLMYTIPPFILGLPKIDMEDCVVYLVYQLRTAGFETRYTYPNLIYISWTHHEKEYIVGQSPILQAMVTTAEQAKAEAARAAKASKQMQSAFSVASRPKKAVSFAAGAVAAPKAAASAAPKAGLSAGRNPTAADYVPPAIFIQTMEKPEPAKGSAGTTLSW
jgi:hypothetical protein